MPVSLFGASRPGREANPRCFSWIRTYEKTNDLLHFDFESTEAFRLNTQLSYQELCEVLMREMEIKDRTAKKYIVYMREQGALTQDTNGNDQKGERCRT